MRMMMKLSRCFCLLGLTLLLCGTGCFSGKHSPSLSGEEDADRNGPGIVRASRGVLAPVYAPLAEQIVSDFDLSAKEGIGIDVGSGPGTLIVELCERTRLHWVNADINPSVFAPFYRLAEQRGFADRVSAMFADAHALPFHDNYADIIVSRGSFHLWEDKVRAFGEIYRVLKPGAPAYIGRGFSENLPVETARAIREKQRKRMKYDVDETADELYDVMTVLGIKAFKIHRPQPPASEGVNYGIWVEFRKPKRAKDAK